MSSSGAEAAGSASTPSATTRAPRRRPGPRRRRCRAPRRASTRGGVERVQAQQPHGRGGRAADALVRRARRRRPAAPSPAARAARPSTTGWCAPAAGRRPARRVRPRARWRGRPASAAGRACGRRAAARGTAVRASAASSSTQRVASGGGRGGQRRRDQPGGVQPAAAEALQARGVGDPARRDGRLGPAGVGVPAGGEAAVGQDEQCCATGPSAASVRLDRRRHQKRKYRWAMGSSVAGCGSTSSPSMRTAKRVGVDLRPAAARCSRACPPW